MNISILFPEEPWILEQQLPFDSLYYYGSDRPIHISYGLKHRRNIWAFTDRGVPMKSGIEQWINQQGSITSASTLMMSMISILGNNSR